MTPLQRRVARSPLHQAVDDLDGSLLPPFDILHIGAKLGSVEEPGVLLVNIAPWSAWSKMISIALRSPERWTSTW